MQKFPNSLNYTETNKLPISGMTVPELTAALKKLPGCENLPSYRAKQIFTWIKQGSLSFGEMTSLPGTLIKTLNENHTVRGSKIRSRLLAGDGTEKLVLELKDGNAIETVLLSADENSREKAEKSCEDAFEKAGRFTACLSTQLGCPMGCVFCKTGAMGYVRSLDASEIVEQFLFLSDISKEQQTERRLTHIVVMGMGEPLLNLSALRKALEILCSPLGFGISKRKITVSTAGIYEGIFDMAENGPETELAVSITSAREGLRRRLMPGTANYPLSKLKEALLAYQKKYRRRITLEIVLLGGINTGAEDAHALIDFTAHLDAKVNLIPWNPVKGLYFEGKKLRQSGQKEITDFKLMLENGGLTVTRRYRRGGSICGACGQLGGSQSGVILP